jgi:cytochrome c peroxidase
MIGRALGAITLTSALMGCGGGGDGANDGTQAPTVNPVPAASSEWVWALPSHFAAPVVPADNLMSEAKFQLGRALFHDTRLSVNGIQSCASCHVQSKAFTDGLPVSRGATSEFTHRNAQPLANTAWQTTYTWARPDLTTLEQQMLIPLFAEHPIEMGLTPQNQGAMLARLHSDMGLATQFAFAFPAEAAPINLGNVIKAIATFQRGLVSADSRYDRHLQGREILSASETRGKNLFFGTQAKCASCHGGFNLNQPSQALASTLAAFQNTGLYNIDGLGAFPASNRGLFETTGKPEDMGKFRIASLRNVALTAPYMHDGSIATLDEVLDVYAAGGRLLTNGPHAGDGRQNPFKSELVSGFALQAEDKQDLIAFLHTLTDHSFVANPRFGKPMP